MQIKVTISREPISFRLLLLQTRQLLASLSYRLFHLPKPEDGMPTIRNKFRIVNFSWNQCVPLSGIENNWSFVRYAKTNEVFICMHSLVCMVLGSKRSPGAMAGDNRWYGSVSQSVAFLQSKPFFFSAVLQLTVFQFKLESTAITDILACFLLWRKIHGRYSISLLVAAVDINTFVIGMQPHWNFPSVTDQSYSTKRDYSQVSVSISYSRLAQYEFWWHRYILPACGLDSVNINLHCNLVKIKSFGGFSSTKQLLILLI